MMWSDWGGALETVQIFILAEGLKKFLALSARKSSLVQTFCESCVRLDITHQSVHMARRFVIQGCPTLSKSRITSPQIYLSAQASSLSAFVISKTHIVAQKPRGRQLNAKLYGSESAIFRILQSSLFRPLCQTTITQKRFKYSPSF